MVNALILSKDSALIDTLMVSHVLGTGAQQTEYLITLKMT